MRRQKPKIGTEMYCVCEHLYYIQDHAGPVMEYCVCKGTVRDFFRGSYTEICLHIMGPDGFPRPWRCKLSDVGKRLFFTAEEAAVAARDMTEKYEKTWGWIGAPEFPMARPWANLLEVPVEV